jgi:hypothetical protein
LNTANITGCKNQRAGFVFSSLVRMCLNVDKSSCKPGFDEKFMITEIVSGANTYCDAEVHSFDLVLNIGFSPK